MGDKEQSERSLIMRDAADWFVSNRGGLSPGERDSFTAWLKASPAHIEEYLAIAAIAADLREASSESARSIEALIARAQGQDDTLAETLWSPLSATVPDAAVPRWRTASVALAAVAAVVALVLLWTFRPVAKVSPPDVVMALSYETGHGEQQTHILADKSVLHLNTDSAVTIRYGKTQRLAVLASGEAEFEIAHESTRAFRVLAGSAQIVDLGTKFDVRLEQDATVVTVIEGRAAVGPWAMSGDFDTKPPQAPRFVQLGADQQIKIVVGEPPATPTTVDAQRTTSWLRRQIKFQHEPLERVANEFNRYSAKQIEITTPALRSLEISGVFTTDDTDAFIAFLRSLQGVHVEVTATQIRVSKD
jgi:transmembrane sensor